MAKLRSSCLCGDVVWESDAPLTFMSHCHCSYCRKSHGAAFGTYAAASAEGFRWVEGADRVARYQSSPGFHRPFCPRCGSVVAGDPHDGAVFMPVGTADGDPGARPGAHLFAASKAPWYEIPDDLPRFDAYPPGMPTPDLPARALRDVPEGVLTGSCLCGAVVYEVSGGTPRGIVCCHCSRCRKAASAAHATNLFVPGGELRFVQGESKLRAFRPPDAKVFEQIFCETCGGAMPRDHGDRIRIPAGSLDGDPGVGPKLHIFVGSKADWYEIAEDGLPRFDASPG